MEYLKKRNDEIVDMYLNTEKTYKQIAEAFNMTGSAVCNVLSRRKVLGARQEKNEALAEARFKIMYDMYFNEKRSLRYIGKHFGISAVPWC